MLWWLVVAEVVIDVVIDVIIDVIIDDVIRVLIFWTGGRRPSMRERERDNNCKNQSHHHHSP